MRKSGLLILVVFLINTAVFAENINIVTDLPTKEIEFLLENEVLVGDPDGDLRESDEISRAEFVTILCRAIGIEALAETDAMKNKEIYVDVPNTHWASGYINAATEHGAINGVGNGFFCPEKPVKNEEAIKILVAAWGYTDEAEKMGGYPNGYMAVAQSFGITDSVLFNYGLASKRWVVSVFTYNMLSVAPKEVDVNLAASTKIEKVETPVGENGTGYIQNPSELLEKITLETINYERKVFEQRVPEGEKLPITLEEGIIKYQGSHEYEISRLSVGKTGEKDAAKIDTDNDTEIDISAYGDAEYRIIFTGEKNNIVDTYYTDLIISDGTAMLGESFRITYLRHQPIVESENREISIDSNSDYDIPFEIKADADSNGKIVLCMNYPGLLTKGKTFNYDIVSEEKETLNAMVSGENKTLEPIIIDNLKIDTQYNISIGITEQNGSHNIVKGIMSFYEENNIVKFKISGNHSIVIFKGYKIGE